jgi:quercetin dioxygenase-like cupin family protein
VPPGDGPPPHAHSPEEEGFYILEGEITLQVGDKRIVATAGTFANMPVGTLRSFRLEPSLTPLQQTATCSTGRPARPRLLPAAHDMMQ